MACGLETIQNREGSQVSGTDGQNRRNIFMKWLLCLMHTFFGLCVNVICLSLTFVNVNISVNIKSISQAVQPRCGACEYQTHTGEKSNKCNQYGATTIREYQGEYQTSQAASRAPTIKRSLPILGFCINQHSFLHPGHTIVEIISYTNMNNVVGSSGST